MGNGLPDRFASPDKSYTLYEGIDYQQYWDDPHQRRQDALEQHLITELLPVAGRRIIDLGCGYGRLAPCYLDRFDEVVLYDGSRSLLRQAYREYGNRAVVIAGDVARLPFKSATFDHILSIRVLQHIHDLGRTFDEMQRVLTGQGKLIFSYHNKRNAHRIMHLYKSLKVANPFSLESAEVSPTLLSHHPERVSMLLAGAGFSEPEYHGAVAVDSIARTMELLGAKSPSGMRWATFTGRHRLAPWLIGQTVSRKNSELRSGGTILDLLACPACRGELDRSDEEFRCRSCDRRYPVDEGVIDFRLEGV